MEEFDYEELSMPIANNSMHFLIENEYASENEMLVVVQNPNADYSLTQSIDIKVPYHQFKLFEFGKGQPQPIETYTAMVPFKFESKGSLNRNQWQEVTFPVAFNVGELFKII